LIELTAQKNKQND